MARVHRSRNKITAVLFSGVISRKKYTAANLSRPFYGNPRDVPPPKRLRRERNVPGASKWATEIGLFLGLLRSWSLTSSPMQSPVYFSLAQEKVSIQQKL